MKRPLLLLAVFVLGVGVLLRGPLLHAGEEDPGKALLASKDVRVLTRLDPSGKVLVGQRLTFSIELLTTTFFKGAPRLPEIRLPHVIVLRASQMAVNGSTRIEGKKYASQRWEFWLFADRPGRVDIPSLDVTIRVAGEAGKAIDVHARTEALGFEAQLPPGVTGGPLVPVTTSLTMEEAREGDPSSLRVGDAFKRQITLTIDGAPGMLIPPLPPVEADSLATAYPDAPRVEDETNRGALEGRRTESTTWVMARPGTFTLPAVAVRWFDLGTDTLEVATLPEIELVIRDNPDLRAGEEGLDRSGGGRGGRMPGAGAPYLRGLLLLLLLALATALVHAYGRPWREARAAHRREKEDGVQAWFSRFETACLQGDAPGARRALVAWLDRIAPGDRTISLQAMVAHVGDPALETAVRDIEGRLYGGTPPLGAWNGEALLRSVRRTRKGIRGTASASSDPLRLNPRGRRSAWPR